MAGAGCCCRDTPPAGPPLPGTLKKAGPLEAEEGGGIEEEEEEEEGGGA